MKRDVRVYAAPDAIIYSHSNGQAEALIENLRPQSVWLDCDLQPTPFRGIIVVRYWCIFCPSEHDRIGLGPRVIYGDIVSKFSVQLEPANYDAGLRVRPTGHDFFGVLLYRMGTQKKDVPVIWQQRLIQLVYNYVNNRYCWVMSKIQLLLRGVFGNFKCNAQSTIFFKIKLLKYDYLL